MKNKILKNKILYITFALALLSLALTVHMHITFGKNVEQTIENNSNIVLKAVERIQKDYAQKGSGVVEQFRQYAKTVDFPTGGNVLGTSDIVIYEWMDFQCGYCKASYKVLEEMTAEDKNITIKYIEFPILGKDSVLASLVALSAEKQGKYVAYHGRMMSFKGKLNKKIIWEQAKLAGLDMKQVELDVKSDVLKKIIERNLSLGKSVGAKGTPYMIIYSKDKGEIVGGFAKKKVMQNIIKKLRNK